MNKPKETQSEPEPACPTNSAVEFDPQTGLPIGQQWFSPTWLAQHWDCTTQHVFNLIEDGEFIIGGIAPIDLARKHEKTRSTTRVPRAAVIHFQNQRKHQATRCPSRPTGESEF